MLFGAGGESSDFFVIESGTTANDSSHQLRIPAWPR
jgi:hypothetical protein